MADDKELNSGAVPASECSFCGRVIDFERGHICSVDKRGDVPPSQLWSKDLATLSDEHNREMFIRKRRQILFGEN